MFPLCVSILLAAGEVPADLAAPPPVQPAAAPAASDGDVEALKFNEATQLGIRLFQQGDYDGAIAALTAAYAIHPKPLLLFNLGQAHRKAGRPQEALAAYEHFLSTAGDSPLRQETLAYIELVRTQLKARLPAPVLSPAPAPQSDLAPPAHGVPLYKRGWLWGVVGSVVAVTTGVAVGVYLGLRPPQTTLGVVEPTF